MIHHLKNDFVRTENDKVNVTLHGIFSRIETSCDFCGKEIKKGRQVAVTVCTDGEKAIFCSEYCKEEFDK